MARPKDMFLKAKTCKHAVKFTGNQGLFVRTTCKCPNKLMLPVPDKRGIRVKIPYIMAKKCINCKGYIDARKVKEKSKFQNNFFASSQQNLKQLEDY